MELMEYLQGCHLSDIRTKMLYNTIFDLDSQMEIKQKIDKFKIFSNRTQPASQNIFNELQRDNDQVDFF